MNVYLRYDKYGDLVSGWTEPDWEPDEEGDLWALPQEGIEEVKVHKLAQ